MPDARCAHRFRRPSADASLVICEACGHITGARTREGEFEVQRHLARWGGGGEGTPDYTVRRPLRAAPVSRKRRAA